MDAKAKKTVWILISNRWNSAITEYALSSAMALKKRGFKVVVSPLASSIAETRALTYALDIRSFKHFGIGSLFKFKKILSELNPDAVFTFGGPETFLTKFILGKTPKVFRFKGQDDDAKIEKSGFLKTRSLSHCHALVVPSELVKKNVALEFSKSIHKVTLGCDTVVFKRFETMGSKKRPEIVILGRLDPIKGHEHAMKIMSLVLKNWSDPQRKPRLHIIGQAANLSEIDIAKFAQEAGLVLEEDVIISARRVSPIAKYLSEAVIGFIPSIGSEIICRVAEEFLLCGTPIVVSGAGSLAEVLFEGAGESYKDLDDSEAAAIVSKWVQLSISEGEMEKRRRANKAKEQFSLEKMGEALEPVLLG